MARFTRWGGDTASDTWRSLLKLDRRGLFWDGSRRWNKSRDLVSGWRLPEWIASDVNRGTRNDYPAPGGKEWRQQRLREEWGVASSHREDKTRSSLETAGDSGKAEGTSLPESPSKSNRGRERLGVLERQARVRGGGRNGATEFQGRIKAFTANGMRDTTTITSQLSG
jgi:hypothetical protein